MKQFDEILKTLSDKQFFVNHRIDCYDDEEDKDFSANDWLLHFGIDDIVFAHLASNPQNNTYYSLYIAIFTTHFKLKPIDNKTVVKLLRYYNINTYNVSIDDALDELDARICDSIDDNKDIELIQLFKLNDFSSECSQILNCT